MIGRNRSSPAKGCTQTTPPRTENRREPTQYPTGAYAPTASLDDTAAAGKLHLAVLRTARRYPFHAALLARMPRVRHGAIDTMAVTVRHGAATLLYDPSFVHGCALEELTAVVLHELNHVLFGHIWLDPAAFTDRDAFLVATETVANEFVTADPLPAGAITLADYPQLPPRESTEARYRRLAQGHALHRDASGSGPRSLDDHAPWDESRADASSSIVARAAIADAHAALGPNERARLPEQVKHAIDAWERGVAPGAITAHVPSAEGKASVPWGRVLRAFVSEELRDRASLQRPPRRAPGLLGIVPGVVRERARPHVVAIIDTSGSITVDLLGRIASELRAIRRQCEARVTIVETDCVVHRWYSFQRDLTRVEGRGGTDFRPALKPAFLAKLAPDVVVYLTDGDGPAPARAPATPVIWCISPGGRRPVAWGRFVAMS